MGLVAIQDIFSAGAQSTYLFLIENGQGCYIPAYQRPYSWDKDNAARLFEDAANGIEELLRRDSTISFLGTVIAIHDTKHVTVEPLLKPEVPQKVMTIIDGQQRICTMQMMNMAFHDLISRSSKTFAGKADDASKWIEEDCRIRLAELQKALAIDMNAGEGTYQFYPRIIRAMDDQWSRRKAHAFYTSPIARLNWEYIVHFKAGDGKPFRYDPEDAHGKIASHQPLAETFRYIQREIMQICAAKMGDHALPSVDVLVQNPNIGDGLWGYALPPAVVTFIKDGAGQAKYAEYCQLFRLLLLSRYTNHRMAFTIVTTKGEDDAFNMFEALNTTGEPLTAFETLKPKIIASEVMAEYAKSPSFQHVSAVESHLDRFKKAEDKQAATSELLVPFALAECGEKQSKRLSEQRRFLRDSYEAAGDINAKRDFLHSLANLANFMRTAWSSTSTGPADFSPVDVPNDDVQLCFHALRDLKHSIAIAPLIRFYDAACRARIDERTARIDDLSGAIRATTAFSMLWRGAKGGTENIDSQYREIMRSGVKSLGIAPLAKSVDNVPGVTSLDHYKAALRHLLVTKGGLPDKEAWAKAAAHTPIYQHSVVVARFLLFCATDDALSDDAEPGLVKRGRPGFAPIYRLENWRQDTYYTVEHIAPRKGNEHWPATFYEEPELINRLGNLILLPEEANGLIGNRAWAHKRKFYELLGSDTVEDQQKIKGEMKKLGLVLSKNGEKIIDAAGYNQTCKAITKVTGDWSIELIEKRSRRIAELAWDKLAPWMGLP
jgi:hypothetical protein